jgi:hypothetical protein
VKLVILVTSIYPATPLDGTRYPAASGPKVSPIKAMQQLIRSAGVCVLWLALTGVNPAWAAATVTAGTTMAQRDAALDFLQAVASGDAEAVASTIHPDDLKALRLRILNLLHEEAKHNDTTVRDRLFGPGRPLDEIEHLTDTGFYGSLADRLFLPGRDYDYAEGVASVTEKDGKVEVLLRGRQPRDRGKVLVLNVVTIKPFGRDWKAALPSEIEAQIDDLIAGRHSTVAATRSPAALRGGRGTLPAQPGIVELLGDSEKLLSDGKCDEYYGKQMSPNFRRVTSKKALEALISACKNSLGTREMLLSTLHIVRGLEPHYAYEGQRAIYDLSGQGLPFDHFVLEQVNKHWYVAE